MPKFYIFSLLLISALIIGPPAWGQSNQPDLEHGTPEPGPAPARERRPPVTYSTPEAEPAPNRNYPASPPNDFENLYYQREVWKQYQQDYENHSRPKPGGKR